MWEKVRIDGKKKLKACAIPTIFVGGTNRMYMLLSEKASETSAKRKNILDSITILRRKSRYSTKNSLQGWCYIEFLRNSIGLHFLKKSIGYVTGELQKGGDKQLCRNQVTNNSETNNSNKTNNNNEFKDAYETKFEQLGTLKTIPSYLNVPSDSIND